MNDGHPARQAITSARIFIEPAVRPKLLSELKPGTRIVSHGVDMGDWKPAATYKVGTSAVYYWVVPERKMNS